MPDPQNILLKSTYEELFSPVKTNWPYLLLISDLVFNSFRPDKLLPGGGAITYFPTFLTILLLFNWIRTPEKKINNIQTKFYFLLLVLMICQLPFVRNYGVALFTVKSTLIYGITGYIFLVQYIDNFARVNQYIRLYTIFGVFFALIGLILGGNVNIPVLSDENDFCLYVNCLLPFAFFLGQEATQLRKKFFYYTLVAIYLAANVASYSRGGFIGLLAVGLYLLYQTKHKFVYALIIIVVAFSIIKFAPPLYLSEISTINTKSYNQGTGSERVLSWSAGWRMFLEHPLFGVGVNNYGPWLPDYWEGEKLQSNMWGRVAHSVYLTLLSEMGVAGIFLFIGILWGNIQNHRYICRSEKNKNEFLASSLLTDEEKQIISSEIGKIYLFSKAFSGSLIAFLITGIFISVLWYEYFWNISAYFALTSNLAHKTESLLNLSKKL